MFKKLVFVVLGIFSIGLFGNACDDVCLSSDRCYECVNNNISECVPTYTNSSEILDSYSDWNCSVINKETYIKKLLNTICQVDNFLENGCNIRIQSPFKCPEVCLSSDTCYQCENNNSLACVPTYTNSSEILESYRDWNCSVFKEKIDTKKLLHNICQIDNFVDEVCNSTIGTNDNSFCLVAHYINNVCKYLSEHNPPSVTQSGLYPA